MVSAENVALAVKLLFRVYFSSYKLSVLLLVDLFLFCFTRNTPFR